jgi:hypothetical protein
MTTETELETRDAVDRAEETLREVTRLDCADAHIHYADGEYGFSLTNQAFDVRSDETPLAGLVRELRRLAGVLEGVAR